jgi:hypothetical protein
MKEISSRFGRGRERVVFLVVGRAYVVEPMNPQAKRFRGRPCILLSVDDEFMPSVATVKFTDTTKGGQPAKVQCSDLVDAAEQTGIQAVIDRAVAPVRAAPTQEAAIERSLEGLAQLKAANASVSEITQFAQRVRSFLPEKPESEAKH